MLMSPQLSGKFNGISPLLILGFVFGIIGFALAIVCFVKLQLLETSLKEKGILRKISRKSNSLFKKTETENPSLKSHNTALRTRCNYLAVFGIRTKLAQKLPNKTRASNTNLRHSSRHKPQTFGNRELTFQAYKQPVETDICLVVDPTKQFQSLLGIGGCLDRRSLRKRLQNFLKPVSSKS